MDKAEQVAMSALGCAVRGLIKLLNAAYCTTGQSFEEVVRTYGPSAGLTDEEISVLLLIQIDDSPPSISAN